LRRQGWQLLLLRLLLLLLEEVALIADLERQWTIQQHQVTQGS